MINIDIVLDKTNNLYSCKAKGHAGAGKTGTDIVCAAVAVLMRTAIIVLSDRHGIKIQSDAPEPGHVWLKTEYTSQGSDFLFAVKEFLITGLSSVAEEFPDKCELVISG